MLFLLFLSFLSAARAALVNITIDDTLGDTLTRALVTYTPPDAWQPCPGNSACAAGVDPTRLVAGTWHESTFSVNASNGLANVPLTATASFNGSAIYVFCAIPRSATDPNGDIDLSFFLDGVLASTFTRRAIGSAGFDYSVPVYANSALPAGQHTLIVQNGRQNGGNSLVLLDSIVYTHDDGAAFDDNPPSSTPSPSSSRRSLSGASLAVIIILVIAIVVLLVAVLVLAARRRRRNRPTYARYMPKGAVHVFPSFVDPSSRSVQPFALAGSPAIPPPAYNGNVTGKWWVGRDQKGPSHRPYTDLDPAQAGFQHPQRWEHSLPR